MPPTEMFAQVFGTEASTVERDLALYYPSSLVRCAAPRGQSRADSQSRVFRGEPLPDAEAAAYLGDAMAHLGRIDDARAFLKAAIDKSPAPRTIAALGLAGDA